MLAELMTLLVPASLLMLLFVPKHFANHLAKNLRSIVPVAMVVQLAIALVSLGLTLGERDALSPVVSAQGIERIIDGLDHYDGVSGLMFTLVSFLGVVVCKFSVRYLDGDRQQGNYFRWLGFTLGAVSLLVVAGNLVLLFIAWVMTSFGLHHLLLHYRHRPWAQRAAWTKFTISRLGDVFLLIALILVHREFGSYHLADILEAASQVTQPSWQLSLVGWFLMLGAVTKSAQFPVHFWLPETMEAPTPVSALMHAGIVNAGGYLLVRLSPVVVHSPTAMATLAVIGGFTAVFAALVMMTQANVKRALGYSTIAQMGFMMLQCGLGAYSAAMLHIIAHSLYKAHAFLRTGDAWRVEYLPANQKSKVSADTSTGSMFSVVWREIELAIGVLAVGAVLLTLGNIVGVELAAKAGGIVLGMVICLAIATWASQAFREALFVGGKILGVSVGAIALYLVSFSLIDAVTRSYLPVADNQAALSVVGMLLIALFSLLAMLQTLMPKSTRLRWLQVVYVHASNGFYVDTIIRRRLGLSLAHTPSAS